MNKLISGIIVLQVFVVVSCARNKNEKTNESKQENNIVAIDDTAIFSGTIKNAAGKLLKYSSFFGSKKATVKELILDESGNFSFKYIKKHLNVIELNIENEFLLLPFDGDSKTPFFKASFPNMDLNFKVNNTSKNFLELRKYFQLISSDKMKIKELSKKMNVSPKDDQKILFDSLIHYKKNIELITRNKIIENPSSPNSISYISNIYPVFGLSNWDTANLEVLNNVISAYKEKYSNESILGNLEKDVSAISEELSNKIKIGKKAPEINLNNPKGIKIPLSSLEGKVVLIDFWASWCSPCRRVNPHIVKLYNKYKNKGFTVYSVSLDNDKEKWKNAIKEDGLIWENHVSDLKAWDTPLINLYKFSSIPHTILIDKNNVIQLINEHNLDKLEQKLQNLLKK